MRYFIFLIPVFLFACKKNDSDPRILLRQQPSRIAFFSVDTGTGTQTLQYEINYFYNDSIKRFDSIFVDDKMYRLDYSKITTENKVLLNFTNVSNAYEELIFDPNFYFLKTYNQRSSSSTIISSNNLQYDGASKLTNLNFSATPNDDNFAQSFTYKNDSIFAYTSRPFDVCEINDTIINSFIEMSTSLPYLLFTNINNTCGAFNTNILNAIAISSYINKFPFKIINGNTETNYTYKGDSKFRLSEASIITKQKSNGLIIKKLKIQVTY